MELAARVDLLVHLMYEPLFNRLRTNETLGYSVDCSARNTNGVMGFCISVTSATATPLYIERRATAFVQRFLRTLGRMRRAAFATNVEAAAANKLLDDHNLAEEMQRGLVEIESRQYCWDRAEQEAAAIRAVSLAELCAWAKENLLGAARHALSVHSHEGSIAQPENQPMAEGGVAVNDAAAFKANLPIFRRADRPMPPLDATAASGI